MNLTIATAHKKKFFSLINSAGQDVLVRSPATRATSTTEVDKIFGTSGSTETDFGPTLTIKAWIHQGKIPGTFAFTPMEAGAGPLGILAESDIILLIKLEEVLVVAEQVYGRTTIDQAKDIQVSGSTFKVTGTFRSGLAPLGPYLYWVGLENMGE